MFGIVALVLASSPFALADESFVQRAERRLAALPALAERLPASETERAMLADAADGRWDKFDLLSAALITENRSQAERRRASQRLDDHVAAARRQLAASPDAPAAELLFAYLHERILTDRFSPDCHTIGETLASGRFNCLSGTVLFVGLAERCGVSAQAVLAPSHVYARTSSGGRVEDVETTCPTWFREPVPRRSAWMRSALGEDTRAERHRPLTSVELLAVVYYNRGVACFARRDFAAAAADNLVALRLDANNAAAADNLLAAINNWALDAANHGRLDLAEELLRRGRQVAPDRKDLQTSQHYIAGQQPMQSAAIGP
ncbi:MAG: hypothetical protein WD875_09690 [Pirellulales bacterium]